MARALDNGKDPTGRARGGLRHRIRDLAQSAAAIAAFTVIGLFLYALLEPVSSTLVAFWTSLMITFHP